MSYEMLLEWISEAANGTWEDFKLAHEWGVRAEILPSEIEPSWAVTTLATLGHLEMDWINRAWAVAPAVLTILPNAGAHALLIGSRTRTLKRRLDEVTAENSNLWAHRHEQRGAPDALFFQTKDEQEIETVARALEIRYEFSVVERLSRLLPPLASYLAISASSPAPPGYEAEIFEIAQLRWLAAGSVGAPGLYRFKVYGGYEYRYMSRDGVHRVDSNVGIYLALNAGTRTVMRYEPETVNGTLAVRGGAPLPLLHARTAVLCSGLVPEYSRADGYIRYANVPQNIAERIAWAVGQDLEAPGARENGPRVPGRPPQWSRG